MNAVEFLTGSAVESILQPNIFLSRQSEFISDLVGRLAGLYRSWSFGLYVGRLVYTAVGPSVYLSVGWSIPQLVLQSICRSVGLFRSWSFGLSVNWLVDRNTAVVPLI